MAFLLDNHVRRYTSCGTSLLRWRVESDQPFFDNDFLDLVLRTPHAWRFRHQLYLHMLRTCFPEVAEVRWQRTGLRAGAPRWLLYVSLGIHRLNRYKLLQPLFRSRQVSSFDGWIRGPLRNYVTGLLNDPRTLDRGLCDPDTLRRAVQDHVDSGLNNSTLLGSLMALELFARLFVDRDMELIERCRISAPSAHVVNLGTVT